MLRQPLTNLKIEKYYQNEPRFNGVYCRDNPPKIKNGAYVVNLDEYSDIGTHWVALYVHNNDVTYFPSFGVEHIPKEIKAFINNKAITTNIFRIQPYDSIICGYFCIGFIDFMLTGKTLTEFTNLFSPNNFKINDNFKLFYDKWVKIAEHEIPNMYPNLSANTSNDQQFRQNKINEIKDYFIAEIKEKELTSKNLSKYIASFGYFDKPLIVLSVATGSISIVSFATVIGAPLVMMSASCSLAFSITT